MFLDLDGTLTDSSPGIVRCLAHALGRLGRPAPPPHELDWCIGPPLAEVFGRLLDTREPGPIEEGISAYRERYQDVGLFECALYPGTHDALQRMRAAGHALRVVTSKPSHYATRIVAHFGIDELAGPVHGPSLDARRYGKAELIAEALAASGAAPARTCMVGDRAADVIGARAHGVRAVRAGWGYGRDAEFASVPPDYVARDLLDVARWIDGA